jgi:hypothetical protein
MEDLTVGLDAEGRRLLLVEGAKTPVAMPRLPEGDVAADDTDDVGPGAYLIDQMIRDPSHPDPWLLAAGRGRLESSPTKNRPDAS